MGYGSLYARLLGRDFGRLPPILRAFHAATAGGHAHGFVTIRHAHGRLGRLMATLAGLPRAGEQVPVELRTEPHGTHERWRRRFRSRWTVSDQWQEDGLLAERVGPVVLLQRLGVIDGRLTFESVGNRLGSWRLPGAGLIRVRAAAWDDGVDWCMAVHIATPLGELTTYEGRMQPWP